MSSGANTGRGDAVDLDVTNPSGHVLVEIDLPPRLEDDIDLYVVTERLVDPHRVGPFDLEGALAEQLEGPFGVLGTTEDVDVLGPARSSVRCRGHPADGAERHVGEGRDDVAQHAGKHLIVRAGSALGVAV